MFWRIIVNAAFPDLPPPSYLKDIRDYFLAHAVNINPGLPQEEASFISLQKCYHDEDPAKPCDVIEHYTV